MSKTSTFSVICTFFKNAALGYAHFRQNLHDYGDTHAWHVLNQAVNGDWKLCAKLCVFMGLPFWIACSKDGAAKRSGQWPLYNLA